jgi:pimeloyl-ACP methyl ester carboxylesterase
MPYIETAKSGIAAPVKLYYQDTLKGKPVIFIHGWPHNSNLWEYQFNVLPKHGIRCIAYDRRGFGLSDKPYSEHDYDTLSADLKSVIDELGLEDVTLVGFSMGGGEVARYIANYGTSKIDKVVLVSSILPYMLKTDDNPSGIPEDVFVDFITKIQIDRPAFMADFAKAFFGVGLISRPVSNSFLDATLMEVMKASSKATTDCILSFARTDFRKDCAKINVPVLIVHGDADKIVPIETGGKRAIERIPHAELLIYEGAPHGLYYTEKEKLNEDLLAFIGVETENVFETQTSERLY